MVEGDLNSVIFHLGIARHVPYIWKSMDVWLICAIIQPSLPSLILASPVHPLTFLPPPSLLKTFASPPSASFILIRFNFLFFLLT